MVAAVSRREGGAFGIAAAAAGAVFLATASYMTLKEAVTPRDAQPPARQQSLEGLSPGELTERREEASARFASNPLDATAIVELSRVAGVEGQAEAAERLKLSAGSMMPRDPKVQAEALGILLERRDFDQAMNRLDGLVRSSPADAGNFFLLAATISADPDGSAAVARMLASDPPWRAKYFSYLLSKQQSDVASDLLDDLRGMGATVADSEVRSLIDFYVKASDLDQAYAVWLSSLSEEELKDVGEVYDGGFRHPVRSLGFDWTVKEGKGLAYRLFPRNTASTDQTLQLDFQGFAGSFSNLSQMLRLRPGRYRLSGEARFDGFSSPTGLVFRIYCRPAGSLKLLDETATLPQSTQWIAFDKTFVVPDAGCDNQLLRLESRTKLLSTQLTSGVAALDTVSIETLPVLAP